MRAAFFRLAGLAIATAAPLTAGDPFADRVVSYIPGNAPTPGYTSPLTALGSPERFTGEGVFDGAVTMFNPAFGVDEIVSIGEGGSLTLEFFEPILDNPANRFGVDLIVFGNGGFIDADFPNGQITPGASLFGVDPMRISVSADGVNFVTLPGLYEEGLFPAQGYLDSLVFDSNPGTRPTDFTRALNPALTRADFAGLTYAQALALYDGSGGGTPVDIAAAGLTSVRFVRIETPDDGNPLTTGNVEIDGLSVVPEPSTFLLVCSAAFLAAFRRKKQAVRSTGPAQVV